MATATARARFPSALTPYYLSIRRRPIDINIDIEGGHAYLCSRDTAKQKAATAYATAFIAVVQTLPGFNIHGPKLRASMTSRPAEPPISFLRDNLGAVLRKPSDAERRADVGIRTAGGAWRANDFKKEAAIQGGNRKAACAKQGAAVKAGDKGKISSYQLSISNFDALRHRIHMAVVDNHGTLSKGYDKLLKAIASHAYPGNGLLGKWDVDGLRSRCVARLRTAVAAGVWRANYYTISGWANDPDGDSSASVASHFHA